MSHTVKAIPIERTDTSPPGVISRGIVRPYDDVELSYAVIHGNTLGPTLLITGGVHGCEVNAMETARRLSRMPAEHLSGTLVILPILNVLALEKHVPFIMPEDRKNLNRQFPGKPNGTKSERIAHWLTTEVYPKCDSYLDLHSGDATEDLCPFTAFVEDNPESKALAIAFGLPRALSVRSNNTTSTLKGAVAANRPSIIVEVGCGARWSESEVLLAMEGIARVMSHLSMLVRPSHLSQLTAEEAKSWNASGRLVTPFEEPHEPTRIYKAKTHTAPCAGFWKPDVKLNDLIEEGQQLGQIEDVWGTNVITVRAEVSGFYVYGSFALWVNQNEALVCVATAIDE